MHLKPAKNWPSRGPAKRARRTIQQPEYKHARNLDPGDLLASHCRSLISVRRCVVRGGLAYNLIRTIIAQAAAKHDVEPRTISFKGVIQTLEAFEPVIAMQGCHDAAFCEYLYQQLLDK